MERNFLLALLGSGNLLSDPFLEGWGLLFSAYKWAIRVKDFRTVGRIFVHDTTVAELLDETSLALNIGIRNITDFIRVKAIPTISTFCR